MNVVDNCEIGRRVKEAQKKVKVIHVYRKKQRHFVGTTGDKVLVTILGEMKKGYIVGCVQEQPAFVPRFDSNNVVLVDDHDVPLGTRITVPIPNVLRKHGAATARLMAIGTKFI